MHLGAGEIEPFSNAGDRVRGDITLGRLDRMQYRQQRAFHCRIAVENGVEVVDVDGSGHELPR